MRHAAFAVMAGLFMLGGIASADAPKRLGPSFSCAGVRSDALASAICFDPGLSRLDLSFVQAYQALKQQLGAEGAPALAREDLAFLNAVRIACDLAAPGKPAPKRAPSGTSFDCVRSRYEKQRVVWLERLTGTAREEAEHSLDLQVALQRDLQEAGYLPSTAAADGVYGPGTRAAIIKWQAAHGQAPDGLMSDATVATIMPAAAAGKWTEVAKASQREQLEAQAISAWLTVVQKSPEMLTCSDFLQAPPEVQRGPLIGRVIWPVMRELDRMDMLRGCKSAIQDVRLTSSGNQRFIAQMCQTDPDQMLSGLGRSLYGIDRAIAKSGFGDGCQ